MAGDRTAVRLEVATLQHVGIVAAAMRRADRAEVLASHGFTPAQALMASLASSTFARTVFIGGEAAAMFGVRGGQVWALTTDAVDRHRAAFWRASKYVIEQLIAVYPALSQCVDARHGQALRWARRLGFKVDSETHPCGPLGLPFHRIQIGAPLG